MKTLITAKVDTVVLLQNFILFGLKYDYENINLLCQNFTLTLSYKAIKIFLLLST